MIGPGAGMKAWVYSRYGGADRLSLSDLPVPELSPGHVLVRVRAVSLNSSDREFLVGRPVYTRFTAPFRPCVTVLGSDIAGTVQAVAPDVSRFHVGDRVFGDALYTWGGLAEYAAVPADRLVLKPPSISWEVAASLPQASLVALQGLEWGGAPAPGEEILVNGGGGGSGTFALQLARAAGARVTGVDRTEKQDAMRAAGAHEVIDYTSVDPTRTGRRYDRILDLHATRPLHAWRRVLAPGGSYAVAGGTFGAILRAAAVAPIVSRIHGVRMGMLIARANEGLDRIVSLVESGAVVPVIDQRFAFRDADRAMARFCSGRSVGKIVISMPSIE